MFFRFRNIFYVNVQKLFINSKKCDYTVSLESQPYASDSQFLASSGCYPRYSFPYAETNVELENAP